MLKITEQTGEGTGSMSLLLEGRLAGPWVEEVDSYWRRLDEHQRRRTVINLGGVTFVDGEGKALLARMWKTGARFVAAGCLMRCLVDEITGADTSASAWPREKRLD
ncbi:MAG: hypothetical protein P0111_01000 [Nitrospira sp.]|nr:hypothetical protein [Nitrospira sp.]